MTSGTFNSRPTGTVATTNLGLFGAPAATAHGQTNDNLDTTWIRVFNPATSYWEVILSFPTVTLAADEYIYRRRVRLRTSYDNNGAVGSPNVANWDVWMLNSGGIPVAMNDHYGPVGFGSQDPYTLNGGWKQPSNAAVAWKQADLNTPRVHIYGFIGTTAFFPRIYEVYLDREIKTLPTTTVSAPTGTQTVSTQPATIFTYSSVDNFAITAYQVKIFTAAQYGAGGFDPETSTPFWNSGVVSVPDGRVPVAGVRPTIPLTNSTTFKSYVQVRNGGTQNPNFTPKSLWVASPAYTQNVTDPSVLTISPVLNTPRAQIDITLQGTQNMLDYDAASFEIGTGGWTGDVNASVARSTAKFADGIASLRITATAGGDATAAGPFDLAIAGATYSARAQFCANATTRSVRVGINWYNSSFGFISSSVGSSVAEGGTTFPGVTASVVSATAPALTSFARVTTTILAAAAAEQHFVDKVSIKPLANVTWTRGGLADNQTATIRRSINSGPYEDIATVVLPFLTAGYTQNYVFSDTSAPFGVPITYKAFTTSIDPLTPDDALESVETAATSPLTLTINDWWLSDLQIPANSLAVSVMNETFKFGEHEEMAEYNPIGRKFPLIVSDVIHGLTAPLILEFLTKADYDAFRALRQLQKTLVLKSPMVAGEQWYIRIRDDVEYEVYNTKPDLYRTAAFQVIEQDVPTF